MGFNLQHYNDGSEVSSEDRFLYFWLTVAMVVVSLLVLAAVVALGFGA